MVGEVLVRILLLASVLAAEDCSNEVSFPNLDSDLVFTGSDNTPLNETRSYIVRVDTLLKGSLQQVPSHCWSKEKLLQVLRENGTCDIQLNNEEIYIFFVQIPGRSLCPVLDRRSPPTVLNIDHHRRVSRQSTVGKWNRKFSSPACLQYVYTRMIHVARTCRCLCIYGYGNIQP